jgi:hypothetical protein
MHMVIVDADEMQENGEVLTFIRDGRRVARFSQYMGWVERLEEPEKPKEAASVLSLVPNDRPTPPPGDAA